MRAQSVSVSSNAYGIRSRSSVVKQSHRVISDEKSSSYLGGSGEKAQHPAQSPLQRPSIISEAKKLQSPQKLQQQQQQLPQQQAFQLSPSLYQSPVVVNAYSHLDSIPSWKKNSNLSNSGNTATNEKTVFGQQRQWNIFSVNGEQQQQPSSSGAVAILSGGSGGSGGQFWMKQQQQQLQQQNAKGSYNMIGGSNWPLKEDIPVSSVKHAAESRFQVRGSSQVVYEGLISGVSAAGQQWEQSPRSQMIKLQIQQQQQQQLQQQLYQTPVRMLTKEGEKQSGSSKKRGYSQQTGASNNLQGSSPFAMNSSSIGSTALDVKLMQLNEEFKQSISNGGGLGLGLAASNRKQQSNERNASERAQMQMQHRDSKRVNLRDSIVAVDGAKSSSDFDSQSQQQLPQYLLTEDESRNSITFMGISNGSGSTAVGGSGAGVFLTPQKNNGMVTSTTTTTTATFESEYQLAKSKQLRAQNNENARNLSKRSFSAIKNGPAQVTGSSNAYSVSAVKGRTTTRESSQQQLMILQVKQLCTKKRYNDPMEIKKMKDRMKEVKEARLSALVGGGAAAAAAAVTGLRGGVKGKVVGEEDDDDSDEGGSGDDDVSLDLDDDDENDKLNSLLALGSANTSATLTPASKVHLLKSIYAGRPMTVFFPYHKSCQQPKQRDMTRAVPCSDFEIKQFDLKYKINGDNPYKCVVKAFEEAGFVATSEGDWNSQWSLPKKDKVRKMNPFQRLNHFPGCWNLGRKDFMWRCLNRAKRRNPKEMDFVPNTYLLCNQGDWDRFLTKKEEASKNQLWICKPADQACGRGIKVISKSSKVKRKTNRIICDYIMNPHLIDGLKYDLRLYVLVTSYDPLRIYLYEEGLTRFATEKYTTNTKEVTKRYVHLTNYSVNKFAKKFVKNTNSENDGEGSKWSHTALRAKYTAMGIDVEELFAKISDVIIKTCISAEPNMLDIHAKSSEHRTNCYELYGFDVLIDAKLKPWILEVNVCPSLSSSSPLDRKIKHSLLVDTLNIIGITPYDKKHYQEESKKNGVFHRASMRSVGMEIEEKSVGITGHHHYAGGNSAMMMMLAAEPKKNFSKNINDIQDLNAENCLEKLSPENWEVLFETDEEYHRRGKFERIYPPMSAEKRDYYAQFFEFQRFNNTIINKWMSSNVNFLEKIIKKKYNTSV